MRSSSNNIFSGFTLVELMVAISLGMIIVTFAVPSFSSFIKNGRVTTVSNELATDINYARSEAVSRGAKIILCRSGNPTAPAPQCGGDANTWTSGWLVFQNNDTNEIFDAGVDTMLRITPGLEGDISIKTNSTSNSELVYTNDGTIDTSGSTAVFAVCDERGEGYGNQLQISPTGRPRLISPVPNTCTSPDV